MWIFTAYICSRDVIVQQYCVNAVSHCLPDLQIVYILETLVTFYPNGYTCQKVHYCVSVGVSTLLQHYWTLVKNI